ncbi:hypothetical protein SAMN05216574_11471 [Blastococcus tunisiensis]|uniref:Uncharacterized protein n=1 Tax=Blastococcus tunisiensis TaxID=1798228 RepID=A0A1I2IV96_9ACTN|nr:hypothetical protein SAMN05216574_11471 [Blastococcus sp. DSM 46838]
MEEVRTIGVEEELLVVDGAGRPVLLGRTPGTQVHPLDSRHVHRELA